MRPPTVVIIIRHRAKIPKRHAEGQGLTQIAHHAAILLEGTSSNAQSTPSSFKEKRTIPKKVDTQPKVILPDLLYPQILVLEVATSLKRATFTGLDKN
jgi:hypothetical protein